MRRLTFLLALCAVLMLAVGGTPALADTLGNGPRPADDDAVVIAQATQTETPDADTEQSTETEPPPSNEGDGRCDNVGLGLGILCEGVSGAIGGGVDAFVTGGARAAMASVVEFVVYGAAWLLGQIGGVLDESTRPDVTAGWFQASYADMATIAVLGLLPFLLLSIIQAIVRQSIGQLVRSTFVYVPLAALGTGAAVVVVDMLVRLTDELSGWVGRSMGPDLTSFTADLAAALAAMVGPSGGAVAGFAALLAGGAVAFVTFVIWLELLLRQAAIYVAVLFLPLAFMAMVWPATAHWVRRLFQGLVAIILSKFVIVAVMALAAAALDANVAEEGFGVVIAGASLLSLAALAPYVLLRLIPVFEAGLSSSLEGTFRRPTAAVGTPAAATAGRGQITRMLRQRVGSPGAASSGGGRLTSAGAGGGSPLTAAVRSGGGAKAGGAGVAKGAGAAGAAAAAGVGLATAGAGTARRASSQAVHGTAAVADRSATAGADTTGGQRPQPTPPSATPARPSRAAAGGSGDTARPTTHDDSSPNDETRER